MVDICQGVTDELINLIREIIIIWRRIFWDLVRVVLGKGCAVIDDCWIYGFKLIKVINDTFLF